MTSGLVENPGLRAAQYTIVTKMDELMKAFIRTHCALCLQDRPVECDKNKVVLIRSNQLFVGQQRQQQYQYQNIVELP